jgi:hypothetical protein
MNTDNDKNNMNGVTFTDQEKAKLALGLAAATGMTPADIDAIRCKVDALCGGEFSRAVAFRERHTRWVNSSARTTRFEKFMMIAVQGLGNLDCQLVHQDDNYCSLSEHDLAKRPEMHEATYRFTLSYLWVLGAYEIIRTMDARVRENPGLLSAPAAQQLSELKRAFERIRIPLAKMESAKKHPTDSHIAYPAFHRQLGIAWQLGPDVFVCRRELSDLFLGFIERLPED